jgi:hypothetical protein
MTMPVMKDIRPEDINPNSDYNPSTGMLVRNPTHKEIAENADDQREIVNAIKQSQAQRQIAVYDYSDRSRIPGLPGVLKIRELDEANMLGFCMTLMRVKPNIIGINLKLGNYSGTRNYNGAKISKLRSNKPRNPTEVAEDMAALLSDRLLNVVEVEYKINSVSAGHFESTATAKYVSEEEYNDSSKFQPYLEIEYYKL